MEYLQFTTTQEWWLTLHRLPGSKFGAPDGSLVNLSKTAMCVMKLPYCYICKDPVGSIILERETHNVPWRISRIVTIRNVTLTKDHITPVVNGGNNSKSNLATCCYTCNQFKGNALSPVFCQGFARYAALTNTLDQWKATSASNAEALTEKTVFKTYKQPTGYCKR